MREQRERETAYRKFVLELYHATPVSGHVWLHGVKGGRMVHVAAVDAPVTRADVNAIVAEVWRAAGKGPNSPQKPRRGRAGLGARSRNQRYRQRNRRPSSRRCRIQENPKLELSVRREYPEPGKYTVVVKVIDILGNDTTKT